VYGNHVGEGIGAEIIRSCNQGYGVVFIRQAAVKVAMGKIHVRCIQKRCTITKVPFTQQTVPMELLVKSTSTESQMAVSDFANPLNQG